MGHVVQMEGEWYRVVAQLKARDIWGDHLIPGIQPLQVGVKVAGCPTGQYDVIALYGCLGFDSDFLVIFEKDCGIIFWNIYVLCS